MKKFSIIVFVFVATLILYLPIILHPTLATVRGNDFQEFFWPIYYFVKNHLFSLHSLPFWNPLFLSGVPLISDPQAPLFYIPNIIYLLTSIDNGFIISSLLHTTLGGLGMYFVARKGYSFNRKSSLIASLFYVFSTRWMGYLDAGHVGLITATAWLPFVLLFTTQLARKAHPTNALLYALSLALVFYSHPTTFLLTVSVSSLYIATVWLFYVRKNTIKTFLSFFLSGILTFGLVAIAFLPQLAWIPQTNRILLLKTREVYPQWQSLSEYLKALWYPWEDIVYSNDSEKWLALGIGASILSTLGLLKLSRKTKILLSALFLIVLLFSLNNVSPFYAEMLSFDWYVYIRVATRIWFIISLAIPLLIGYYINKQKHFRLSVYALVVLSLTELCALSWFRINRPLVNTRDTATEKVYKYLSEDKDTEFRVFCTTRCFSQQDVARYHLQTIGGYSTLHQKNYYEHSWGMTGTYWDYYTLALPPIGSHKYANLIPDFTQLGEYNTKYIVSSHELDDLYAKLTTNVDGFYIYENTAYEPRSYFISVTGERSTIPYIRLASHKIRLDTNNKVGSLYVSEVYSENWRATTKDGTKLAIQERPNALLQIDIPSETDIVTLEYTPQEYIYGRTITYVTLLIFGIYLGYYVYTHKKLRNGR